MAAVHGSYLAHLLPALLVFGIGGGLTLPALATLGMSAASAEDAGRVSGLFNTSQQIGAAAGVALLSTIAVARTGQLLSAREPLAAALTGGYRVAFGAGAALAMLALIVAAILVRPVCRGREPVRRPGRDPGRVHPGPARSSLARQASQSASTERNQNDRVG
jgi:MFS family permease